MMHGFLKFAEAVAKAFASGTLVKSAIRKIADEAKGRKDLSESEKHRLDTDIDEFCETIDGIWRDEQDAQKLVQIQQLVLMVASIAGRHGVSQSYVQELDKLRAAAANDARRADDVQAIIEAAARKLWEKKQSFYGKPQSTAELIRGDVRHELSKLEAIPTGWALAEDNNPKEVKKEVDRIRNRVKRMDECHSSN